MRRRATIPLEHFIVYSSIAAIAGSPRQANYAAGNTFLEGLIRYRRQLGLPGLAIQWGALSGSGFVERNEKTLAFLEKTGSEVLPGRRRRSPFLGQLLDREVATLAVARSRLGDDGSLLSDDRAAPALSRVARGRRARPFTPPFPRPPATPRLNRSPTRHRRGLSRRPDRRRLRDRGRHTRPRNARHPHGTSIP
jgi:hypothetical protein